MFLGSSGAVWDPSPEGGQQELSREPGDLSTAPEGARERRGVICSRGAAAQGRHWGGALQGPHRSAQRETAFGVHSLQAEQIPTMSSRQYCALTPHPLCPAFLLGQREPYYSHRKGRLPYPFEVGLGHVICFSQKHVDRETVCLSEQEISRHSRFVSAWAAA